MRLFRRAAKHGFASKSRWLAFLPDRRHVKPNAQRSRFSMKATTDINPQLVKQLREKTNAGMMDCKRALAEAEGSRVRVRRCRARPRKASLLLTFICRARSAFWWK